MPTPPVDAQKRSEVETKIFGAMSKLVVSAGVRAANLAGLWMKVPALQPFSPLVESANILYYRGEYIPLVLTLVPIIEGVLLNWYGYNYQTDKMPKDHQLMNFMVEQFPTNPKGNHFVIWEEYVRAFVNIYENIFYGTHVGAEENSFFNRHYVVHGMGDGWFYHRNNVCKLTLLVDLLAHIVADSTGHHDRFHVKPAEMKPHYDCYCKISKFELTYSFGVRNLLKLHSSYKGNV